jgi:hypothetical protein
MPCCKPYQFPFANQAFTDINYTPEMRESLGEAPKIEVFYWDPEAGEYYQTNGVPGSQMKFDGETISVDHGGLATGIIKLS